MSTTRTKPRSTKRPKAAEQAQDEFRQVFYTEWAGNEHLLAYYKVQRLWWVQDPKGKVCVLWSPDDVDFTKVREEWRYLPEVTAEEAAK